MITLRKINSKEIVINCELIESIEGGADTIVSLTTHAKFVVMDPPHEIIHKVIEYHKAINRRGINVRVHTDTADGTEAVPE